MTISALTGGFTLPYTSKTANVSQHLGLSHNHSQAVDAINTKTGGNYSIDVEKRAANAELITSLLV